MSRTFAASVSTIGVLTLAACSDGARLGAAGESCTSARDCRQELACVALVCIERPSSTEPASAVGSSCETRRDCPAGLVCVGNACQAAGVSPAEVGSRFSARGESCRAKNDCAGELACVNSSCQEVKLPFAHTKKSCHRVECAKNEDCCAGFTPNANCDVYRQNCDSDPIFCNTYRALCECSQNCVEELCVTAAPGCRDDAECTSQQTPFCVQGKCSACDQDSACGDPGARCVEGTCIAACSVDEHCAPLHRCQDGVCTEAGCRSDRECAFLTKDALAVCRDGDCLVPCQVDTDCKSTMSEDSLGFEVCEAGACVFVGCENDAECRALLGLADPQSRARAVCR